MFLSLLLTFSSLVCWVRVQPWHSHPIWRARFQKNRFLGNLHFRIASRENFESDVKTMLQVQSAANFGLRHISLHFLVRHCQTLKMLAESSSNQMELQTLTLGSFTLQDALEQKAQTATARFQEPQPGTGGCRFRIEAERRQRQGGGAFAA